MNAILHMIKRPGFIIDNLPRSVDQFRGRMRKYMPCIEPELVKVTCTRRRARNVEEGGEERVTKTKRTVKYTSVLRIISDVMRTPNLRAQLRWGIDDVGDGGVSEFNQTPFVKHCFKWSRLMSFFHKKHEFHVGDFVRGPTQADVWEPALSSLSTLGDGSIIRIDSLVYQFANRRQDLREEVGYAYVPILVFDGTVIKQVQEKVLVETAQTVRILV